MIDKFFPQYAICFILTFTLTVLIEKALIPALSREAKQPIYEGGPSWHKSKSGTPTLGGLAFLLAIIVSLSCFSFFLFEKDMKNEAISVLLCMGFGVLNSSVGIFDDLVKLRKKRNAGLKPYQKLALQFCIATAFLSLRRYLLFNDTKISLSFGEIELGLFYYPICIIILLGITNCANLTDGIDGLAGSVSLATGVSIFYISCALSPAASFVSAAIIGAAVGFLIFNVHPAKIFMGDTGSLLFGALASSVVFALDNPLLIIPTGAIYVIEGLSVILQVLYYKMTKKRLFKMAPLHHHLEKCGWSENKICLTAIILTLVVSIPAYVFYLP
jgi:phospho-N-acetylmuramoyl-pentapeptide-transferase